MIKCCADTENALLVVLGLSNANVRELKKGRPIAFPAREVELSFRNKPDCMFVIAWPDDAVKRLRAEGSPKVGLLLLLDEKLLSNMRDSKYITLRVEEHLHQARVNGKRKPIDILLFLFEEGREMEIEQDFQKQGLIGPGTKFTRSGFSPSDIRPSMN